MAGDVDTYRVGSHCLAHSPVGFGAQILADPFVRGDAPMGNLGYFVPHSLLKLCAQQQKGPVKFHSVALEIGGQVVGVGSGQIPTGEFLLGEMAGGELLSPPLLNEA